MSNIKQFIDSIDVLNTAKVVRHVLGGIDADMDIKSYNRTELEQFILALKPSSPKEITTICYVLGLYARWLQDQGIAMGDSLYDLIQTLDKQTLWKKAKPAAKKKFISYERYAQVVHDIGMYEDFNALYYQVLFKSVYEGIYCDDLSVLKNLRAADINGNIVTLREDNGHSYDIEISEELAHELKDLAQIDVWERRNRYGLCRVNMRGLYYDSVFKIEDRTTAADDSYKFTFYAKLRKIAKEYIECPLLPLHLYISGIMHRIKSEMDENGISIETAFSDHCRDKEAYTIISHELNRCNYTVGMGNFREIVKGHLESF